jgi:uncharacterized protein (DUF2237 family)
MRTIYPSQIPCSKQFISTAVWFLEKTAQRALSTQVFPHFADHSSFSFCSGIGHGPLLGRWFSPCHAKPAGHAAAMEPNAPLPRNVLGTELACCCQEPRTGYYRDGFCRTGPGDVGMHVICVQVTAEFLNFSIARGNDLSTPRLEYLFPGLKPGDRWCVCAERWVEALEANCAPPVVLEACHASALEYASLEDLMAHAVAPDGTARQDGE